MNFSLFLSSKFSEQNSSFNLFQHNKSDIKKSTKNNYLCTYSWDTGFIERIVTSDVCMLGVDWFLRRFRWRRDVIVGFLLLESGVVDDHGLLAVHEMVGLHSFPFDDRTGVVSAEQQQRNLLG